MPDTVTAIYSKAFDNCTSIAEITIPASVAQISGKAVGYVLDNSGTDVKKEGFTIVCEKGSKAESYAQTNGFNIKYYTSRTPGDVNEDGKVNIKDVMLIQQHIIGWNVTLNTANADVNADDKINIKDVMLIQQKIVGWKVTLL